MLIRIIKIVKIKIELLKSCSQHVIIEDIYKVLGQLRNCWIPLQTFNQMSGILNNQILLK